MSFTLRYASHARCSTYCKSTTAFVRVLVVSFSRRADTSGALLHGVPLLPMASGAPCRWEVFFFDMLMMKADPLVWGQELVSHNFVQWSSRRNHVPHPESFIQDTENLDIKSKYDNDTCQESEM